MPDIVFAKDLEGRYGAGNAAWAQLLGQPASVLIGQLDSDLFPLDQANNFRRNDLAMLSSGQPQRNEEWVTYPNGRQALLDTLKSPLRDAGGHVISLVGVCREIAANKINR
jgi:two-component system sensor histidine kinase/response regulator